jgi:hypothetical protein
MHARTHRTDSPGAAIPSRRDIVDRIDDLVDEQLAGGEQSPGDELGDPTYPRCPHCDRHWHGLPITERIAVMYARGVYEDDYRADADDSRMLCCGSQFIGPMPSESGAYSYPTPPKWLERLIDDTASFVASEIGMVLGVPHFDPDVLRGMIEQPNPLP